ncbi:glucokinase [Phenylobacterium deserti]|uniref:glucokinase n=1 Tax=Phenylobacterium deserti TaxID=1914756 RepID=UPI001401E910|nr:glucokinase [Phenylobacterium deserti]
MNDVALVAAICPAACRFALMSDLAAAQPALSHFMEFRAGDFAGVVEAFQAYADALGRPLPPRLGISVSAPVNGTEHTITQSGWRISEQELAQAFGFTRIVPINDAAAVALALSVMDMRDAAPLGGSALPHNPLGVGRYALISLDFGLGVSAVGLSAQGVRIIDTEAGHMAFAPQCELEEKLASRLRAVHGRVSYERLLGWPGLSQIHAILADRFGTGEEPLSPLEVVLNGRPGGDPACVQALACYSRILGSFAGDVALSMGIDGGVFLTGRFLFEAHDQADWAGFRKRFEAKGRLSHFVKGVPTWALANPGSVLTGAARKLVIELALDSGRSAQAQADADPAPIVSLPPQVEAQELLDGAAAGLLVLNPDLSIAASNDRFWVGSSAPPHLRRNGRMIEEAFYAMAEAGDWTHETASSAFGRLSERQPYSLERSALGGMLLRDDARPLPDGRWVITSQDITRAARRARELEDLAGELREARNAAEAANRTKSAFLATMSHEIRTPLNGVLGMVQAIAFDELSTIQRERLDIIRQSGESLLAILNDILDLSKIEAGQLELEEVDFDLRTLLLGAHAAFTALANKKGLSFTLQVEDGSDGTYRGDPTRLRQILYNVVSNALKFTEAGEVRVSAGYAEGELRLTVADTGIGVDPARLPALFDRFTQADTSTTRQYGGTGLGLAICRELAMMMGGSIAAESAVGQGTTVVFRAPMPKVASRPAAAALPSDEGPARQMALRVLAAEDNAVNRLVLKTLLHQLGIDPVIVEDGQQAVDAWETSTWDVVLMDIQMPKLDGVSAAREIRRREAESGRAHTPIIALTANAMSHQISEYMKAGMNGHVAKPIQAEALFRAIVEQVDGDSRESEPKAQAVG